MLNIFSAFFYSIKSHETKYDLLWFLLIPILNIIYLITGQLYNIGYDISLSIDNIIPLLPVFIIPYIYWYLFVPIGMINFLLVDRLKYIKVFLTIFLGMIICYIFFAIFPTEYSRPNIIDNAILNKLILAIYSNDKPFNCFPSIHVLTTYLIMRYTGYNNSKKLLSIYTQITGVLIILSTFFIKQHFVLDAIAAIALSEVIMLFMSLLNSSALEFILLLPLKLISRKKNSLSSQDIESKNR